MQPNADKSQPYDVQSNEQPTSHHRATVQEAAKLLGISPEAVRARIQRGTLLKEKDPDGKVYVRLDTDQTRSNGDKSSNESSVQSSNPTRLVASLEEQVSFLRAELVTRNEELRRKDHIIAALTERIPELPAPASSPESSLEPSGAPETVPEEAGTGNNVPPPGDQEPSQRRSWLHRFFFGEQG